MAPLSSPRRSTTAEQLRRPVPDGAIVAACVVVGTLWVLSGGPAADTIAELTVLPRWAVELGRGLLLVALTATVLRALSPRTPRPGITGVETRHVASRTDAHEDRDRLQATALAGTGNAVIITGWDGTIEWVNEGFQTMSGYPSSAAIGHTLRLIRSDEHDESFHRELWHTILAGEVWRGQVVNRRRDGQLYTVSQTITPVIDERGAAQHFVAVQEDISDRVRAARELDASRAQLQALFDHAIDAIVLIDDRGRCIEVNPAVCRLTGHPREELLGRRLADLVAPDQLSDGAPDPFGGLVGGRSASGTVTLQHAAGHVTEAEFRAVSDIQPGVHLAVLRDVTERYGMLRALTLAETEFRKLAEDATDIVAKLRVDGDGQLRLDYLNPAGVTALGYSRERLAGDPDLLGELFHQRSDDLDGALDLRPTTAEPLRVATVHVRRADGTRVWLEMHATLTDPTSTPVTIQLVARDVTARAEMTQALEQALEDQLAAAEQLRALNAMKDTFLQNISHELRTPLTTILGFSHLLADPRHGLSPGDTREFHRRILTNAQRLQRLLDDLLDIDRATHGHIEPNRLPTDLVALTERVVADADLGDHAVELDLEPVTIDLDAPRVARIVGNLIDNVVRHTPRATTLWIRTRATADGAELTVEDDGPGVPPTDRQRVVEPFQQGTAAAASPQPGTGVGLSLVEALAQAHGGGLTLTGRPGGGTRVTVTLAHGRTRTS